MKRLALLLIAACSSDPATSPVTDAGTASSDAHAGPRFCATPTAADVICEDFEVAPLVPASWTVVAPSYGGFEAGDDWESAITLQAKPTTITPSSAAGGVALMRTIPVATRPTSLALHFRVRVLDEKKGAVLAQLRTNSLGEGLTVTSNGGKLAFTSTTASGAPVGSSLPLDQNWHLVDFEVAQNGTAKLTVDGADQSLAAALLSPLDVGEISLEIGSFQKNPFTSTNNDLAIVAFDDVRLSLP